MLKSSLSGRYIIYDVILSHSAWPPSWWWVVVVWDCFWNTHSSWLSESLRENNILGHDLLLWLYRFLQLLLLHFFLVLKADRLRIFQLVRFNNNLIMAWAGKVYGCISEIIWQIHRLIIQIIEAVLIGVVNTPHLITQWSSPIS